MIKKPFRFLKNLMRWYEKEGENILKEVRNETINPELWKKAEDNFNSRGLPIPMYENHDKDKVVGQVFKIEAQEDGLYVIEHELSDRGLELVKNGEYPLPSGDFVLHKDEDGNIVDLEVFGVSLVNSEGAKDVELVTMNKDGNKIPLYKIKIKQNKGAKIMDKEEVLELLLDDDFIKSIPDDVYKKIVEIKTSSVKEDTESGQVSEEEEEAVMNGEEDDAKGGHSSKEDASQSKEEDKRKLIDEVAGIMKSAGASDEDIRTAIKKMEEIAYDDDTKETAKMNTEEEEEEKKIEVKSNNKEEDAAMSKFNNKIAEYEAETGARVVPSSIKSAVNFIKRNYKYMGNKAIDMAFKELSFYGGRKVEYATMNKDKKQSVGDIVNDLLKY